MGSSADCRFPLSFYYKMADQMVKQAGVSREEGNLDDLFLALNRHARLVSEVIPRHPSYSKCTLKEKKLHAQILHEFAKEVETLKPILERKDSDFTASSRLRESSHLLSQRQTDNGCTLTGYIDGKVNHCSAPRKGHMFTQMNTGVASIIASDTWNSCTLCQSPFPVAFTAVREHNINVHMVKHMFPSPVLSCTEHPPLVGHVSHFTIPESRNKYLESSCEESSSQSIHDMHISARLMDEFMELARANTDEDLETCGILGASLENQTFYVTTLIIPKQESSSNSCQALNEEEIYTIQYDQSLFPAGWIHTHPSQTCFLSSIDLHTQYSYQLMLPEAVAIVMAPTDPIRSYGIFRLTDPGGMTVLKQCQERGFHPHPETADGSPIFQTCSNVYINPNLRFEIIDLR